jgi:hypothetical protein
VNETFTLSSRHSDRRMIRATCGFSPVLRGSLGARRFTRRAFVTAQRVRMFPQCVKSAISAEAGLAGMKMASSG